MVDLLKNLEPSHIFNQLIKAKISSVNAGWQEFDLVFTNRKIIVDGDECHGATNFDNYTIMLSVDMFDEKAQEILLHEMIHLVLDSCGLDRGTDETEQRVLNEDLTYSVSRGVIQLIKLNPELMTLLNKKWTK